MGTILASAIISKVNTILFDTAKVRWPDAELLVYLNDGQRQLVLFKPDAYIVNDVYCLVAGTKQSIPDGTASFQNASSVTLKEGVALIDIIRNMGTDGLTAGQSISPIEKKDLDEYNPDWHSDTGAAAVKNYIYNERDPKHFYVYPKNLGTGYIEVAYSALPADIATTATVITLSDVYEQSLRNYTLHRAYAKDAAISPLAAAKSVDYWNLFVQGIGRMDLIKKAISPNTPQNNPLTGNIG